MSTAAGHPDPVTVTGGSAAPDPVVASATSRRAVVAGSFGNFVEWFDFSVYGFFATVIATQFFPSSDPLASLLATFAVFGLTFGARPVGALAFGHFGDRLGRRTTLAAAVLLMGFASLLIAVLPNYATIGAWAPALLVVARLLQGLSAGGEVGGSSSFLVEFAPAGRRGLYGSWQQFTIVLGLLAGSGLGALLGAILSDEAMQSWGWRVPFIAGAVLALVGLYLRLRLEETPAFRALESAHEVATAPLRGVFSSYMTVLLRGVGLFIAPTVSSYIVLIYMPTYLNKQVGLALPQALLVNAIALVLLAALTPVLAALSDRVGRRPLLLVFNAGLVVLTYPLFLLISQGSFAAVLAGQLLFMVVVAFWYGPGTAYYTELFPTKVRYTGIGVSLGIAAAAFGGTAPLIATWLISVTGNAMSPVLYVIAAAVVSLFTVHRMSETAHTPLRHS